MNLANKLTFSRIISIPFFMTGLLIGNVSSNYLLVLVGKYAAWLIFLSATLTDLYDGRIARKQNTVTAFGSFFDPIADKLLVSSALICFVELGLIPAWMVVVIIAREFIITSLRILGAEKGEVIAAGLLGKYKTFSQMVAINLILFYLALKDTLISIHRWDQTLEKISPLVIYVLMLWTVIATVISGISYIKRYYYLIADGIK